MPLKTPHFWYSNSNSIASLCLLPASWLYGIGQRIKMRRSSSAYKAPCPVICIGNAVAGGAGKTPLTLAIIDLLQHHDIAKHPTILTRGYKAKAKTPALVSKNHNADDVGDEALLLSRHAHTIISPNRKDGAKLAEEQKADLIVMDDGFQNIQLHKDLNIMVIDGESGFGNERLIPAGPLREDIKNALSRSDMIVMIGEDKRNIVPRLTKHIPIIHARIKANSSVKPSGSYLAFCGLARPEKFFSTLERYGYDVIKTISFADHHPYTEQDIETLKRKAETLNATLITTEKDHVKINDTDIETLPITLEWNSTEDKDLVLQHIRTVMPI